MMKERDPSVVWMGAVVSVGILLLLLLIQFTKPAVLNLPAHWLALAALPLLVTLFLGGYITKFSGFGLELEAAVKKTVEEVPLSLVEDAISLDGRGKSSVRSLEQLPLLEKVSVKWLSFHESRPNTYVPGAVKEYLKQLPNLEHLEIRRSTGEISCFLPTSALRHDESTVQRENIARFLTSLEAGTVALDYASQVINLQISSDTNIVDALKKMRVAGSPFAAVLSSDGSYQGVVLASDLETKVTDAVLKDL
jgi:hypothetical protein